MSEALLIIDMQTALVPALWRGEELASRIALVAQRARGQGVPVIAIQQTGPTGTPFDPEDPGWQLNPQLRLQDDDLPGPGTGDQAGVGAPGPDEQLVGEGVAVEAGGDGQPVAPPVGGLQPVELVGFAAPRPGAGLAADPATGPPTAPSDAPATSRQSDRHPPSSHLPTP